MSQTTFRQFPSLLFLWNLLIQAKKTKQTEQGCTVPKSWSLQHCLEQSLAWGIHRGACKMVFTAALQADGLTAAMCCQYFAHLLHH